VKLRVQSMVVDRNLVEVITAKYRSHVIQLDFNVIGQLSGNDCSTKLVIGAVSTVLQAQIDAANIIHVMSVKQQLHRNKSPSNPTSSEEADNSCFDALPYLTANQGRH